MCVCGSKTVAPPWRANGGTDRRETFRGDGPVRRTDNGAGPDTAGRTWHVQLALDRGSAELISQGHSPTGPRAKCATPLTRWPQ